MNDGYESDNSPKPLKSPKSPLKSPYKAKLTLVEITKDFTKS